MLDSYSRFDPNLSYEYPANARSFGFYGNGLFGDLVLAVEGAQGLGHDHAAVGLLILLYDRGDQAAGEFDNVV